MSIARTPDQSLKPAREEQVSMIDPRLLWAIARRHWRILVGALVLCLAAGAIFTAVQTPRFEATASVMIDQRKQEVVKGDQVLGDLSQTPQSTKSDVVDTEVEVLRAPRLAEAVVRELHLDEVPAYNGTAPPGPLKKLIGGVKRLFGAPADPPSTPELRFGTAVGTVGGSVNVERRGITNVIDIHYKDANPERAAQIADAYARAYIGSQVQDKTDATLAANKWLSDRVGEMRGEVTSAEKDVAQYQASNGLLVATGSQLNEQRVAQLQVDENAARTDLAEKQARLQTAKRQLAAGASGEALGQALSSPVIQSLRAQIAQAQTKQADLLTRYGPKYPDVINSQHDISQLQSEIQQEIGRIMGSLEADVAVSQSRLNTIDAALGGARGTLARDKTAMVQQNELDRNADAKRSLYKSYLERLQQTSTQAGLARPDATQIAHPDVPDKPSDPNVKLNMLLALLAGCSLGLAAVTLLEMLNQGLQTSTQVEQRLGEPAAGSVPLLRKADGAPLDFLVKKPLSVFAESFRKLRVFVQHGGVPGAAPVKTIAVTSALPKEGKTTTAFCFARSLALSGQRVVVVDCDTRVRSLSRMAGFDAQPGLVGVLEGRIALESALQRDQKSEASILPVGAQDPQQRDLLGSDAMDVLLERLKAQFDFVILDCPPALAVSDALSVAHKADGVLFLVRWGATSSRAADYALQALRTAGASVLGVALTQVDVRAQSRYGYGDSGYFYNQYSQYYVE